MKHKKRPPVCLPEWGVSLKQEKPPQPRGLLSSLVQGKKRAPSETFLKTLRYHGMQEAVLSRFCA
jgi:hypothetical protein